MPTVSGRLIFESARMAEASPALPGIANVPIVLQETNSGAMLAVSTMQTEIMSLSMSPTAIIRWRNI